MLSVDSKRTVFKRRCLQFPARRHQAWKEHPIVLSCSKTADTEEDFRKEVHQEAVVLQEANTKERAEITSTETARIRRVILGNLPAVKNYISESGCRIGENCAFRHNEVDSQPSKKQKKSGGHGLPWLNNSKQTGCAFQVTDPPKSRSILRTNTKFLGSKRSVRFSKSTLHEVKIRERKRSIAGSYSEV